MAVKNERVFLAYTIFLEPKIMCLNYVPKLINEACHDKLNCLCTIVCLFYFRSVIKCLTMGTHD